MVKPERVRLVIYQTTKNLTDYGMQCTFDALKRLFDAARQTGRIYGMVREAFEREPSEENKKLFDEVRKLYNNTWAVIELTLEKCKREGIR